MRATLFEHPRQLGMKDLPRHAQSLSLDVEAFKNCIDSDRHLAEIDQDAKDAGGVRLTGTPSFIIGKTADKEVSGEVVVGALPLKVFDNAITKALQ
jgi:protein-disulfide isomerase